jgi:hypothetical protein
VLHVRLVHVVFWALARETLVFFAQDCFSVK